MSEDLIEWDSFDPRPDGAYDGILLRVRQGRWDRALFGLVEQRGEGIFFDIPFSNLVVIPTLLSACLLLWKPRKREAKRISEDSSN